jgi:hypothetical protein
MANHRVMQRAGFFLGLFLAAILLAAASSSVHACNRHDQVSKAATHAIAAVKQGAASQTAKQIVRTAVLLPAKVRSEKAHSCCPCGCSQGLCGGALALLTSRFEIPCPIAVANRVRPGDGPTLWRIAIFGMERPPRA